MSIIRMDEENIIRKPFVNSFETFMQNKDFGRENPFRSPVYELCKACEKLGILNMISDILSGKQLFPSKAKWSKLVWGKGWELDNIY